MDTSSDDARDDASLHASLRGDGVSWRKGRTSHVPLDSPSRNAWRHEGSTEDESDDDGEELVLPTEFGRRCVASRTKRKREVERDATDSTRWSVPRRIRTSVAQKKGKNKQVPDATTAPVSDPGFAAFEKHTKGIGMKLLSKMGFKGKLGKDEKGIAKPIEVKMRPQGAGLGAAPVDESQVKEKESRRKPTEKSQVEEEVHVEAEAELWKRKSRERRVKQKMQYKTAEEMLQERAEAAPMKIVDMRGPQVKVMMGADGIGSKAASEEDESPLAGLQHNLRLIVNLNESQIQAVDAKLHHEKDTIRILQRDAERLKQDIQESESKAERLECLQQEVARIEKHVAEQGARTSLDELGDLYLRIRTHYTSEFFEHRIDCIACAHAAPAMVGMFADWEPLDDPRYGVEDVTLWKGILDAHESSAQQTPSKGTFNCFQALLEQAVLPKLRSALLNQWQPLDPEPALALVESWEHIIPPQIKSALLVQCVLPKVHRCIENWKPSLVDASIHHWVHPWLIHMGDHMDPLFAAAKHRIAMALRDWHPSDPSAKELLKPWVRLWGKRTWEKFVQRNVLPKLSEVLKNQLEINPEKQDIEPLKWIMEWDGLASSRQLSYLFARFLFPEWLEVLYEWLVSNPDFDEVSSWYLGWKSLFPEDVLANDVIRQSFNVALEMMNAAVETSGKKVPRPPKQFAFSDGDIPIGGAGLGRKASIFAEDIGLKELVQQYAEENNVAFLPKPGRVHAGLPVYGFGRLSITLDATQQVIRAKVGERWIPMSLEELVIEHERRL